MHNRLIACEVRRSDDASPRNNIESSAVRYTHILAPTRLQAIDRAPLRLAFELAARHNARLTVLCLAPERPLSVSGIEALELLHCAARRFNALAAARGQASPQNVREFLAQVVPDRLLSAVAVRVVSGRGAGGEPLPQIADELGADLVIWTGTLPRRPLSILAAAARHFRQLAWRLTSVRPTKLLLPLPKRNRQFPLP